MNLRRDISAALMAVAFILALFVVALTEPVGPATAQPTIAPTGDPAPAIHYGVPNHAFGKAR